MKRYVFAVLMVLYFEAVLVTASKKVGVCTIEKNGRQAAYNQLCEYSAQHSGNETVTTSWGAPIGDKNNILTVGPRGPALLEDFKFIDEMSHFDSEQIPKRNVHPHGAGAFGEFVVTNDITKYSKASMFSTVGKKTPMFVRFSSAVEFADTQRDNRGFALKFYTDEGNWDLPGINAPVFFIRDPYLFPSTVHNQKVNPVTNLKDFDMNWDFFSLIPETTAHLLMFFSDIGIPASWRNMNGFGVHTYKLVNAQNEPIYCKFIYKTNQGFKTLLPDNATRIAGEDPEYYTRDLYNSIADGNYPSWTFYIQVMTFEQAKNYRFNPFDATKYWTEKEFPLIEVGKFTLNRNPTNYFQDVEQAAFCPARMVPGIEPSPDKLLVGRMFSYVDTQKHRLGVNHQQIPVNCPFHNKAKNYQRNGPSSYNNQGGAPNYYPNSFHGPQANPIYKPPAFSTSGDVDRYNSHDDDNFTQPGEFYREVLNDEQRTRLINELSKQLSVVQDFILERVLKNYHQVDKTFCKRLHARVNEMRANRKK